VCGGFKCLLTGLRPWLTRTHYCCGHIVSNTNVFPFAPARKICCGHKFCVRDTKNVSHFVQKHFWVRNKCFQVCATQETSWATMCPQQCVLVSQGLKFLENLRNIWNYLRNRPIFTNMTDRLSQLTCLQYFLTLDPCKTCWITYSNFSKSG